MNQYRHGEILLQQVDSIPEGAVAKQSDIIATGKTGHDHILKGGQILETPDGNAYLNITAEGAGIDHEEHGLISLQPGQKYEIIRQREYDPYEDAARAVAD